MGQRVIDSRLISRKRFASSSSGSFRKSWYEVSRPELIKGIVRNLGKWISEILNFDVVLALSRIENLNFIRFWIAGHWHTAAHALCTYLLCTLDACVDKILNWFKHFNVLRPILLLSEAYLLSLDVFGIYTSIWHLNRTGCMAQWNTELQKKNHYHTPRLSTHVSSQVQTITSWRRWWAQCHVKRQQPMK